MQFTGKFRSIRRRREFGQGLIEFAVIAGLLLLIMGGTFDLGHLLFTYIELLDAAEEGVQFGSFCPNASSIESEVRANSNFPVDLNSTDVAVIIMFPSGIEKGNPIVVEVEYTNFNFMLPISETLFGTTLRAHASSRIIDSSSCP